MEYCLRADTRLEARTPIEQGRRAGKREVWIFAENGIAITHIRLPRMQDNGSRLRFGQERRVARIGKKGNFIGRGTLQGADSRYLPVRIAAQLGADPF